MDPTAQPVPRTAGAAQLGSRDGVGSGDHDVPFSFGCRPSSGWTYPFTARQYSRLLVMRGRAQDGEFADDRRK